MPQTEPQAVTTLTLTVSAVQALTPIIRSVVLEPADGAALPAYTPGSHLKVHIPGQQEPRCYSLVSLDASVDDCGAPRRYCLGVRLEDPSTGGSRYMHQIKTGDTLQVEAPKNDFPLHEPQAGEDPAILIAGGIGITPIASMAAALKAAGRRYELHYYGRSLAQMAYAAELAAQHGDSLHLHADDDAAAQLPLPALLERFVLSGDVVHVHLNDRNKRAPGQGNDRFGPVLATLRRIGYGGFCAVEPFDYVPDGPTSAARAIGYLRALEETLA